MASYLQKIWDSVPPVLALAWSVICWVAFPDESYIPAAYAVIIAMGMDLLTKIVALSVKNGGYIAATKQKIIYSDTLWRKTSIKIYAYACIVILAGLSMRVTCLEQIGIAVATVAYSFIFIREGQSILENLIDAGADSLKPLLFWMQKKESVLVEKEEQSAYDMIDSAVTNPAAKNDDSNSPI